MHKMFHPMFGSTLAIAAISLCSISSNDDMIGDNAMGGGSGGIDKRDTKVDQGDYSDAAGSSQMQQSMDLGGDPEPGADDDLAGAGQQDAAEGDAVEAPGDNTAGKQEGDTAD